MLQQANDIILDVNDYLRCGYMKSYAYELPNRYNILTAAIQTRVRERLCGGMEPAEYLAQQAAKQREQAMTRLLGSIADLVEIRADEITYFTERGYSTADANRAARAAGWLRLYRSRDFKGFKDIKIKKETWREDVFKQCLNEFRKGWLTFGHKPLKSEVALSKKAWQYETQGCEVLVNKMIGNQNTAKVTEAIEMLLNSIYSQKRKPFALETCMMYNDFVAGRLEIVNTKTGEVFDRADYLDKNGNPVELSESTVWRWLNKPKNRRIVDSMRNDDHYNKKHHIPYVERDLPKHSLSMVSFDDRDLCRKCWTRDEKGKKTVSWVHAYYAYDVSSGAVIGAAYSLKKDTALVEECMRDMFRNLRALGLPMPAEAEVEQHLMKEQEARLRNTFTYLRFCAAGNSQEKSAEHYNRQKKYFGITSEKQLGMANGRWHSRHEAFLSPRQKIFDADNHNYKELIKPAEFEAVIAEDREQTKLYNAMKFGDKNGKMMPFTKRLKGLHREHYGLTRWQVLTTKVHPQCLPMDWNMVAKEWGFSRETSVKNAKSVTIDYSEYWLSTPQIVQRLKPNSTKVKAYWLDCFGKDGGENEINEVYIYQDERLIDRCEKMKHFQKATIERTEEDEKAMYKQFNYLNNYREWIKSESQNKVQPVTTIPTDTIDKAIAAATEKKQKQIAKTAVETPEVIENDANEWAFDPMEYYHKMRMAV